MKQMQTVILAVVMLWGVAGARESACGNRELRGRDIVRIGKMAILVGVLVANGEEWQLKVEERAYDIHLGPSFYREEKGIELKAGRLTTVTGFLHETSMVVATIKLGDRTHVLRDENGRPAWAGRGRSGRGRSGGGRGQSRKSTCSKAEQGTCEKR